LKKLGQDQNGVRKSRSSGVDEVDGRRILRDFRLAMNDTFIRSVMEYGEVLYERRLKANNPSSLNLGAKTLHSPIDPTAA
jgi:hypothetical protein